MQIVNDFYNVNLVEVIFSGTDSLGFFEDKVTFIYNPHDDLYDSTHAICDCCEKIVKDMQIGTQTIAHAIAKVYTLDYRYVYEFIVLD